MSSRKSNCVSSSREHDYENHIDDKKRKRMLSNRESAKRSRMKKEQHINDLNDQITYLKNKNADMVKKINKIEQCYAEVDSKNALLRVQGEELRKRLVLMEGKLVSFDTKKRNQKYGVLDILQDPSLEPWMLQTRPSDGIYQF